MSKHTPSSLFASSYFRDTKEAQQAILRMRRTRAQRAFSEPEDTELPVLEHERIALLRSLLAMPASADTWEDLRQLLDSWGSIPLFSQAIEMTKHYLADWPPGLRRTSMENRKTPSFSLADCLPEHQYREEGETVRREHPHINCHVFFDRRNAKESEKEAHLLEALGEISQCRSLEFQTCRLNDTLLFALRGFEELEVLKADNCQKVSSLEPLKAMTRLRVLSLNSNDLLETLNLLSKTPHLEHLELKKFRDLKDIHGLKNCGELRSLRLETCLALRNVEALQYCRELEHLELILCEVNNLRSLMGLERMKRLRLESLEVQDLSFLNGMAELKELVLEDCRAVVHFHPLASLESLHSLCLSDLLWDDSLQALSKLEQLEHLELLRIEGMEDLRCLQGLRNLKSLRIHGTTSLTSLAGLESLDSLESLELEETQYLTEVEPLSQLTGLKKLRLGTGAFMLPMKFAWSWRQRRDVMRQRFAGTFAQDNPREYQTGEETEQRSQEGSLLLLLPSLHRLETLVLECFSDLSEMDALAEIPSLESLTLQRCQQERWDITSGFPALERLTVYRCEELLSLRFLSPLPSLNSLHVEGCNHLEEFDIDALGELEQLVTRGSLFERAREWRIERVVRGHEFRDPFENED